VVIPAAVSSYSAAAIERAGEVGRADRDLRGGHDLLIVADRLSGLALASSACKLLLEREDA
jgi:hypothetical protein